MRVNEVTADEYCTVIAKYPHIFNTVDFSLLNSGKANKLHFLLFCNHSTRFGLILGERDNSCLYSPFSAPFGGFSSNKPQQFDAIDDAVVALKDYGAECGKRIVLTLPPSFYDEKQYPLFINALHRHAKIRFIDVNYHFVVSSFAIYDTVMERNARKNLKTSLKANLVFECVSRYDKEGVQRAYDVIRKNREEHGYPLRMSLDDVLKTIKLIPADFFLLTLEGHDVAAAQVFHVNDGICQVVYWGDLRKYSHLRPMNNLAYHIFKHYYEQGMKIIDIGPSSENGVPNYGLCSFKESIGCAVSNKFSFEL